VIDVLHVQLKVRVHAVTGCQQASPHIPSRMLPDKQVAHQRVPIPRRDALLEVDEEDAMKRQDRLDVLRVCIPAIKITPRHHSRPHLEYGGDIAGADYLLRADLREEAVDEHAQRNDVAVLLTSQCVQQRNADHTYACSVDSTSLTMLSRCGASWSFVASLYAAASGSIASVCDTRA
jgi:hypothetical protein